MAGVVLDLLTLRGRRGTYGTGLALVARSVPTCPSGDGRVKYEWTDVCVQVDGRVSVGTCVETFTRHVRAHVRK